MNLRFLKQLNESYTHMAPDEVMAYISLLQKKCNPSAEAEFSAYIDEGCDAVGGFSNYTTALANDKDQYDTVIQHLETLSERVDESSLVAILKGDTGEENPS